METVWWAVSLSVLYLDLYSSTMHMEMNCMAAFTNQWSTDCDREDISHSMSTDRRFYDMFREYRPDLTMENIQECAGKLEYLLWFCKAIVLC